WLWILVALVLALMVAWWIWADRDRSEGVSRLDAPVILERVAGSHYANVRSWGGRFFPNS
ncbi:MAG TPA: hypothetical protein VIE88_07915, partial [Vicinamibacteria bacterium]